MCFTRHLSEDSQSTGRDITSLFRILYRNDTTDNWKQIRAPSDELWPLFCPNFYSKTQFHLLPLCSHNHQCGIIWSLAQGGWGLATVLSVLYSVYMVYTLLHKKTISFWWVHIFWARVYDSEPEVLHCLYNAPCNNVQKNPNQISSWLSHNLKMFYYMSHEKNYETKFFQHVGKCHFFLGRVYFVNLDHTQFWQCS